MSTKKTTVQIILGFFTVLLTALGVVFFLVPSVGAAEVESEESVSSSLSSAHVTTSIRNNGIRVMWEKVNGAKSYSVDYCQGDNLGKQVDRKWIRAKNGITDLYYPFLQAQYGEVYHFRVTAYAYDPLRTPSVSNTCVAFYTQKPNLFVANEIDNIRINWQSITNAKKYRFFYREPNLTQKWKSIDTTDTSYFFPANPGKTYQFQVLPISYSGVYGNYSHVNTREFFPSGKGTKPSVSLINTYEGLRIDWNGVARAYAYDIYFRKHGYKEWYKCGERIDRTQYTIYWYGPSDCYVSAGHEYDVQVVPVYNGTANKNLVNHSSVVSKMWYPGNKTDAPTNITLSNKSNGIRVEWDGVQGVDDYVVYYRMHYNDKETALWRFHVVKDKCYYPLLLDDLDAGSRWDIQVRALPRCNGVEASYSNVQYNHYYYPNNRTAKPSLRLSNKSNGVRLEWNEIPGAACYTVYYRPKSRAYWSSVVTFKNYYPYLEAKAGTDYAFQVQAMAESNSGAKSTYSKVQFITYFPVFDGTKFMNTLKDSLGHNGAVYQDYCKASRDTDWCTLYMKYMLETKLDKRLAKALYYNNFADSWVYNARNIVKQDGYTPKVGDIVFIYYGSSAGHVGIVTAIRGNTIDYISGNTKNDSPSLSVVSTNSVKYSFRGPYNYDYPVAGYIPLSQYMTEPK